MSPHKHTSLFPKRPKVKEEKARTDRKKGWPPESMCHSWASLGDAGRSVCTRREGGCVANIDWWRKYVRLASNRR